MQIPQFDGRYAWHVGVVSLVAFLCVYIVVQFFLVQKIRYIRSHRTGCIAENKLAVENLMHANNRLAGRIEEFVKNRWYGPFHRKREEKYLALRKTETNHVGVLEKMQKLATSFDEVDLNSPKVDETTKQNE